MLCCVVLCYALLCCVVLCYAVLCYTVLCCVVLCCVVLCCVILCCVVSCCVVLCCVVLCCVVSCCVVLCCVVLCCVVLCCVVLYCTYCVVLYCVVLCCVVMRFLYVILSVSLTDPLNIHVKLYTCIHHVTTSGCLSLISYTICINRAEDRQFFRKLQLKTLVLDEGHMLKNMATLKYTHLMRIKVHVFCIHVYIHVV